MDTNKLLMLMKARSKSGKPFEMTVSGVSMLPFLKEGDTLTVQQLDKYEIGDILVFPYKNEGTLVHRLLKIEDGWLYCKGDNAFRTEDITVEQAFGKVVAVSGKQPEPKGRQLEVLCKSSMRIGELFVRCGRNVELAKKHLLYKSYQKAFLNQQISLI